MLKLEERIEALEKIAVGRAAESRERVRLVRYKDDATARRYGWKENPWVHVDQWYGENGDEEYAWFERVPDAEQEKENEGGDASCTPVHAEDRTQPAVNTMSSAVGPTPTGAVRQHRAYEAEDWHDVNPVARYNNSDWSEWPDEFYRDKPVPPPPRETEKTIEVTAHYWVGPLGVPQDFHLAPIMAKCEHREWYRERRFRETNPAARRREHSKRGFPDFWFPCDGGECEEREHREIEVVG